MRLAAINNLWGKDCHTDGVNIFIEGRSPTQDELEQIDAEVLRIESQIAATQYQRDRAKEYAKLNQLEMQYDDMVNGTTTWRDAIMEIKARIPAK